MKIVQINTVCGNGSTGKICVAISELLTKRGIENYILYASGDSNYPLAKRYMSQLETKVEALKSRVLGNYGFCSRGATKRLLRELDKIAPDIVHLHNLHGHNVHLGMLLTYLKEKKVKVYWTFHDCWAFTAYCPYYDIAKCDKWARDGCKSCPQRARYSWFFDRSRYLFDKKKELLSGLDLTIITPSHWLASQVKQSFLQQYEVKVIHNGIDLTVFQPRQSDFRAKYGLEDKFIVLGVAFGWGFRKGLDVFIELSKRLDARFQIILVGTNDKVDKQLPDNIISIHRTNNQIELAEIYSAADVFVNPTREENFPTTHMEAIACGTPVVAFDTGGCSEMLGPCGMVVSKDDLEVLRIEVVRQCENLPDFKENYLGWSQRFNENARFRQYISLYVDHDQKKVE